MNGSLYSARGVASRLPSKDTQNAPTYDEMLADEARRLKSELDLAEQACLDRFRSKVFGEEPTP